MFPMRSFALLLVASATRHQEGALSAVQRHRESESESSLEDIISSSELPTFVLVPQSTTGFANKDISWIQSSIEQCWRGTSHKTTDCIQHVLETKWPKLRFNAIISNGYSSSIASDYSAAFLWDDNGSKWKLKVWATKCS
mmetsp:Transcript_29546/g.68479  ORF Transcript_29546/g.68479 Transcript_29546/m.68479 type:complete len:140 (-) Transcript_29546:49-468(-)